MGRALVVEPCRTQCAWTRTVELLDELALFRCLSCGSEWVRTEPWTPADADGTVPPAVRAETRRRG